MPEHLLALCAFAFVAGFIDAIAGGGGLVQIPALFLLLPNATAIPVATVFGTNKLAAIAGTSMAAAQYAQRVKLNWHMLLPAGLAAFIFSFFGARVVALLPRATLEPIILLLMIAVAVHTFWRRDFGTHSHRRFTPRQEQVVGACAGAAIGFYDGFFGPGTGSFLIFLFVGLFGVDFLAASANAKVVNVATNLSALLFFGFNGQILYGYGLPMAAANIAGATVGSRLAILKGNRFVRGFFLVIVSVMIVRFGWQIVFG